MDVQAMRKAMSNRLGKKADGSKQNISDGRTIMTEDLDNFKTIASDSKKQEEKIERMLEKALRRFPVYTEYLKGIKGIAAVSAGWIIGDFDIHVATTVSKMWQYAGLNPGMVKGKKRIKPEQHKGEPVFTEIIRDKKVEALIIGTNEMVKGDRPTPGFVLPYNKPLRTALCGVLADSFIKQGIRYRSVSDEEYEAADDDFRRIHKEKGKQVIDSVTGYAEYYRDHKIRLGHSEKQTRETKKGGAVEEMAWKDTKLKHRDQAAKRYMIKMFLKDLYVAWRELEGLDVRPSYQEEYLGHKHESKPSAYKPMKRTRKAKKVLAEAV